MTNKVSSYANVVTLNETAKLYIMIDTDADSILESRTVTVANLRAWLDTSQVADGATAVGFTYNTPAYTTAGALLALWQNNEVDKFSIDKDGDLWSSSGVINVGGNSIAAATYTEASSHVLADYELHAGITAGTTQTQAGGFQLLSSYNQVSTVANAGDSCVAPEAAAGRVLEVINNGANEMWLWPAVSDDLGAGVDAKVVIGVGESKVYKAYDAVNWHEIGGSTDRGQTFEFFEDFLMKAFDETNENWILNSGSDAEAVDPAIVIAEGGTAFLDAGDGDGTVAQDGSQLVWAIPVQADSGGLEFEARIKIEDITGCSVNIGLTDVTTLEEPFSGASDTITSVASNAVAFLFDDGNTTKEWFMCGVDGDTDATGVGATGTAPVNDTYQTLKCKIDADGEGAEFFIDGVSVGSLTASVVNASTDLYLTAIICGDAGNSAAVGLTVDYMKVKYNR